ncbi:hypothetical protein AX16_000100 [Volvariella volvacea WC 439]|nr:hypothetical protein AX16_000100 [Volvariella volvacea WC 439]
MLRSVAQLSRRQPICARHFSQKVPSSPTRQYILVSAFATAGALGAAYFLLPDASRAAPTSKVEPLSPSHFTPVAVISNESCGPNLKLMELEVPKHLIPVDKGDTFLPISSVFIKDDDIQVERPYTPLHGIESDGRLKFWIKKYPKGEVGRWLHTKKSGEQVEIRGLVKTWPWRDNDWDEVIMISGGTGFTPFYQLFHLLITDESISPRTRFTLLHSSPTPEELPPLPMLDKMRDYAHTHPQRFRLQLYVDRLDNSRNTLPEDVSQTRISKKDIQRATSNDNGVASWWRKWRLSAQPVSERKTLALVCGPMPMIAAIAGPYGRNFSQGPVGGILAELGFTPDRVWKF